MQRGVLPEKYVWLLAGLASARQRLARGAARLLGVPDLAFGGDLELRRLVLVRIAALGVQPARELDRRGALLEHDDRDQLRVELDLDRSVDALRGDQVDRAVALPTRRLRLPAPA